MVPASDIPAFGLLMVTSFSMDWTGITEMAAMESMVIDFRSIAMGVIKEVIMEL